MRRREGAWKEQGADKKRKLFLFSSFIQVSFYSHEGRSEETLRWREQER